jgi:hypothetical protein
MNVYIPRNSLICVNIIELTYSWKTNNSEDKNS